MFPNCIAPTNHLRFRISPDVEIAIGATVLDAQARMTGRAVELLAGHRPGAEDQDAYERVLGDAMAGDETLFAREDYVEEAWRIVDPVLAAGTPVYPVRARAVGARRSGAHHAAGRLGRSHGHRRLHVLNPTSKGAAVPLQLDVFADAVAVAQAAARFIAAQSMAAIAARGRFKFAVSGGRTPWQMLRALAAENVDWTNVHLFQVDERVAPARRSRSQPHAHPREPARARATAARQHPRDAGRGHRPRGRGGNATRRRWPRSPARRRCSTSCTWASVPTATPHRSCRAIPCSTRTSATSR